MSSNLLNSFVARVCNDSVRVDITEDKFDQQRSLCGELGFSRLDGELRAFRNENGANHIHEPWGSIPTSPGPGGEASWIRSHDCRPPEAPPGGFGRAHIHPASRESRLPGANSSMPFFTPDVPSSKRIEIYGQNKAQYPSNIPKTPSRSTLLHKRQPSRKINRKSRSFRHRHVLFTKLTASAIHIHAFSSPLTF